MASREGSARWTGDLKGGFGELVVGQDVWGGAYSAQARFRDVLPGFEDGAGTNPEELLAAAHAACFSMALALDLSESGHAPRSIETSAGVHLRNVDGLPTIQQIDHQVEPVGCANPSVPFRTPPGLAASRRSPRR
jgi:osmotically inducible protein OsmC